MPRPRFLLTLTAACLALAGCKAPPSEITTTVVTRQLADAPTRIEVAGRALTLETYVYRDFMPVSPPDGKPMIAALRVKTEDGSALPPGLGADSAAVIYAEEVWTAPVQGANAGAVPGVLEVFALGGPKWGPGVDVDVVVYLHDAAGRGYLLRAPAQRVHRTS